MTREEQKSITGFIEQAVQPDDGGHDAPMDVEADAIIRALFVRNPEAAYRMTMLAMGQAAELSGIKAELEAERKSFRGNWLSRLLKKQSRIQRHHRRDPHLPMFSQNIRQR